MWDIKKIIDKIDALSPEEQIKIGEYATKKGIHTKQTQKLTDVIWLNPSKNVVKKYLLWHASTEITNESIETQAETFCGIPIDQLSSTQQILYKKLSPLEREGLKEKVSINNTHWHIQFLQLQWNNTIASKDIAKGVMKSWADKAVKNLGNGWTLPRDVDYTAHNKKTLDPVNSDYDAMILQMPGSTDNQKVRNFKLLTGMAWPYRTSQKYSQQSWRFVIRKFYGDTWNRGSDPNNCGLNARPVRSL